MFKIIISCLFLSIILQGCNSTNISKNEQCTTTDDLTIGYLRKLIKKISLDTSLSLATIEAKPINSIEANTLIGKYIPSFSTTSQGKVSKQFLNSKNNVAVLVTSKNSPVILIITTIKEERLKITPDINGFILDLTKDDENQATKIYGLKGAGCGGCFLYTEKGCATCTKGSKLVSSLSLDPALVRDFTINTILPLGFK